MNIEPVQRLLTAIGAPFALIGGRAMAARGYARFTVDVDLLTSDPRVLERAVWAELERAGWTIDCRRGDADDPLGGVVHVMLANATDIDIVVAKWRWQARIIERAELMAVAPGVTIPVTSASDLILLKLAAGGYLDLLDAAALLQIGDSERLALEVEEKIDEVHPNVRHLWRQVRLST